MALYTPGCLSDPRFEGLAEAMQTVVDTDVQNHWISLPSLRQHDGSVTPGMEILVPWESYPDVLDTFFTTTAREAATGVTAKRAVRYYHYIDRESTHNGFQLYYSVVATDHLMWQNDDGNWFPAGSGVSEDPGNNFVSTTPRTDSQTRQQLDVNGRNIYVYPNPATRESLKEYLAQEPTFADPTGVRVTWANLPRAHNTIHIFTESADLVQTIQHDGFSRGRQHQLESHVPQRAGSHQRHLSVRGEIRRGISRLPGTFHGHQVGTRIRFASVPLRH